MLFRRISVKMNNGDTIYIKDIKSKSVEDFLRVFYGNGNHISTSTKKNGDLVAFHSNAISSIEYEIEE